MRQKYIVIAFIVILAIALLIQLGMAAEPERISAGKLKNMLDDENDVIVIDTRSELSYENGHIPGALSMPFPDGIRAGVKTLPKNKLIVLYCA